MDSFHTPRALPIEFATVMGISDKNEGSIGRFGTGLKFAIAVLLRTNHTVKMISDGEVTEFGVSTRTIRDKEIGFITANGSELGFTTNTGVDWTPDMAYREIASNTIDEGGIIARGNDDRTAGYEMATNGTTIEVTGEMEKVPHSKWFINSDLIFSCPDVDIHDPASESLAIFYHTVNVGEIPKKSLYSYNVKSHLNLSEDRELRSFWDFKIYIRNAYVKHVTDIPMLKRVLLAKEFFEQGIDFPEYKEWSQSLKTAFDAVKHDAQCNLSAVRQWKKSQPAADRFESITLNRMQQGTVKKAMNLLEAIGVTITHKITYSPNLGNGVLGLYDSSSDSIFIALSAIEQGSTELMGTLYEEHVHATTKADDYTRKFQDVLLRKIAQIAESLEAETGNP